MRLGLTVFLPGYDQYYADYPSGTAKSSFAQFIRLIITHVGIEPTLRLNIQAASVSVSCHGGCIEIF